MKPWEAAHLRMLETLPKRTHEKWEPDEAKGRPGGRAKQPVIIDGVWYASLNDAARALHKARQTIVSMIRRGEAQALDG